MPETLLSHDWTLRRADGEPEQVTLPHDAMIGEARIPGGGTERHGAFFPGGHYRYSTRWTAPAEAAERRISLFFEGVYGATTVSIDGEAIASNVSGYREFAVPLQGAVVAGREHLIEVDVDNSAVPNSRWYTGSGIYRPVWLRDLPRHHLRRDELDLRTLSIDDGAVLEVTAAAEAGELTGARVSVSLYDAAIRVAEGGAELRDGAARVELRVPEPRLWSHSTPHLYTAVVTLLDASGVVLDRVQRRTGLRTIDVDARNGLRINGNPVLLQGACVHHDNGVLGAATHAAAERRRARILKESGFNAVRSSHNPLSRAFLDACDEVGLYVVDETTDYWRQRKSRYDLSGRFDELWRDDLRSMIDKDRLHPSVILYAIGNEIPDTATAAGVDTTRQLHEFARLLDPTRPTTLAINMMVNLMASRGRDLFADAPAPSAEQSGGQDASTAANVMANRLGAVMGLVSRLPAADRASKDSFAEVSVAGYNYAFTRYRGDRRRYPERVILGTESMPGDLPKVWSLVESTPGVIGDFMWTGWDYLGEVGIGTWTYGDDKPGLAKQYPHLVAGSGAIDITGVPGAPALLARAVWDPAAPPGIAVRPVDRAGLSTNRVAWRSSDAIPTWAWEGNDGTAAEVEVYSADDEVELLLNGRSLGRKRSGARQSFTTRFRTAWEPGELVAIGYRGGVERTRSTLRSLAGKSRLRLTADRPEVAADGHDLLFLEVDLADDRGTVATTESDTVTVTITGAGSLTGFGSAEPATEESFTTARHSTYRGRALAVVRAGRDEGTIVVEATSEKHGTARLEIPVRAPEDTVLPADGAETTDPRPTETR